MIVSGAPATGKSTIVRHLAPALGVPLLAKDDVKETLGDALPPRSRAESQALGRATYRLMFHWAAQLLESGVGLVLESNFYRGLHEPELVPLVRRSRAALIHCYAPPEIALQRYEARFHRGDRHPVHFDAEAIAEARSDDLEAWRRYFVDPMDLGIPTLVVDTSAEFVTEVGPILTFIQTALG